MTAALLLVVLGVAGAPLSLLLCGALAEAVLLAPLLGAAFLSFAATLEIAVGGSELLLAVVALLIGGLVPAAILIRQRTSWRWPGWPSDMLVLAPPLTVLGWTLSTLRRVHVSYDGRSIWFFHARMLIGGHDVYLAQASTFDFGHPDYPPLVPATIALGWRLAGAIDYRTGQLAVAGLTACATLLACLGVARALQWSGWRGGAAASAGALVLYGVWDEYATNGYVDPLCAALVSGAAVHGLLVRPAERRTPFVLSLLLLAALSKNEGLTFALVVLLAFALLRRLDSSGKARAQLRPFLVVGTLMLTWPVMAHARGITSDLNTRARLPGSQGRPLPRLEVVMPALVHMLPVSALGFLAASSLVLVADRAHRLRLVAFLFAQVACLLALLAVYAFGPLEIHFWVTTSLQRTTMTMRACGLLAAVYASGAAAQGMWRNRRQGDEARRQISHLAA